MSNFTSLDHYHIPSDLLVNMLSTYKNIGLNESFDERLKNKKASLFNSSLLDDALSLAGFLKLNLTKDRLRLIITKDSNPRTIEEERAKACKTVLESLRKSASLDYPINSADLLDCLKSLLGDKSIKFKDANFVIQDRKDKTLRFTINNVLDEYEEAYKKQLFEPIALGIIATMELYNIKPYTKGNELATIILFYYVLIRSHAECFLYQGFFKSFLKDLALFYDLIAKGSINYDQGSLYFTDLLSYTFNLISKNYCLMKKPLSDAKIEKQALKSDVIEKAIIEELPAIFSKEDVRKIFPDASDSTFKRVLERLIKKQHIIPLGTGRSAKYQKIVDYNSIEYLTGARKDNED